MVTEAEFTLARRALTEELNSISDGWTVNDGVVWSSGRAHVVVANRCAHALPGHVRPLRFGFTFDRDGREVLWDCATGIGKDRESSVREAVSIWVASTAPALLSWYHRTTFPSAVSLPPGDELGVPGWHAFSGPYFCWGQEGPKERLLNFVIETSPLLRIIWALPQHWIATRPNAIKLFFGSGSPPTTEVRVNGVRHDRASEALATLDWPQLSAYTTFRQYVVLAHPDPSAAPRDRTFLWKAIHWLADCEHRDVEQTVEYLTARGVPGDQAEMLEIFVSLAFGRALLQAWRSQAELSDEFGAHDAHRMAFRAPLEFAPFFQDSLAIAKESQRSGTMAPDLFWALAGRSPEVDLEMRAKKQGSRPSGARISPPVCISLTTDDFDRVAALLESAPIPWIDYHAPDLRPRPPQAYDLEFRVPSRHRPQETGTATGGVPAERIERAEVTHPVQRDGHTYADVRVREAWPSERRAVAVQVSGGNALKLRLAPEMHDGTQIRLRGQGLGGHGDLYLTVRFIR